MFATTDYFIDASSELINTQIVLCGSCGLAWKPEHICPGDLSTALMPFCPTCGYCHDGVSCMSTNIARQR